MRDAHSAISQADCWFAHISWELISQTLPASKIRQTEDEQDLLRGAALSHSALTCLTLTFGVSLSAHTYAHTTYAADLSRPEAYSYKHASALPQMRTYPPNNNAKRSTGCML